MGCIKNDDRSDEAIRREDEAAELLMALDPELSIDAAYDLVRKQDRENRRKRAERRVSERLAPTLFGKGAAR